MFLTLARMFFWVLQVTRRYCWWQTRFASTAWLRVSCNFGTRGFSLADLHLLYPATDQQSVTVGQSCSMLLRPLSLVSNPTRWNDESYWQLLQGSNYVHFGFFNIVPWVADVICWRILWRARSVPGAQQTFCVSSSSTDISFSPLDASSIGFALRSGW